MAGLMSGDPLTHHGAYEGGSFRASQERPDDSGGRWYFSRKEIEENSPSRQDGIDLKKETYLRKSYCTFLQDLGMRLKVPQVTIATAIIFCHRFFLRQSHTRNDRRSIATVCMFLAGKVEETPRPLKDVILVSYEIIHKKDAAAAQRIKQKEVYEHQKELLLQGERVVLATLGFDLNVHHPYKPLVEAIKKFKVAQNALAQVAWNFVNDGLRTSLCLQFKPHHIAAGAIFLAAKFLRVKLPSDGEKVWWQEFDVTPRQLEEVSNQMLELYEQNRVQPSQASEAEGSAGGNQRPAGKASAANEEHAANNSNSLGGAANSNAGTSNRASSRAIPDQPYADNHSGPSEAAQTSTNNYGSAENNASDRIGDDEINDRQKLESEQLAYQGNAAEVQSRSKYGSESHDEDDQEENTGKAETRRKGEPKERYHGRALENKDGRLGQSPQGVKKIDKDKVKAAVENKVKAALEKRRKSHGDVTRKTDVMDDDDLIERELEDGIELAAGNEKIKRERKESWSKPSNRPEHENTYHEKPQDEAGDGHHQGSKRQSSRGEDYDYVEEGELEPYDDADKVYRSPKLNSRKRKASSPSEKLMEGKRDEYVTGSHNQSYQDFPDDRNGAGRLDYSERDHKRQMQENHA
ncbi:cyclin-T1-3-like isoform X1 [Nicotiana tomentosiformis]|uniref:cyclin-T1-3-like isoform X1 n=2 Tax=Nicotiana tomentosiformis TaxID=4098 RepID=UPI00051C28FD|nr:cyclin-T1-4-like isoform X1 [Nicotiana tomentosiformis]XP_009616699.1 cyclin-T1-4-like isoform X1 [Nicotiana tomentosiformis]XP_009616700.1 cyclin-T1-4-like isoform X1 [Nicotiana tomentosiformis]